MRWLRSWLLPLILLILLLIFGGLNSSTIAGGLLLTVWLVYTLTQAKRRGAAIAVVSALLLLAGAAGWLVGHPAIIESYFVRQFQQKLVAGFSGTGMTSRTETAGFVVHYGPTDAGATEVTATLPDARRQVERFFGPLPQGTLVAVYPDLQSMASAMGAEAPDWVTGNHIAGMLVMRSPTDWSDQYRATATVAQIVTHEYTHLATYRLGGRVPKWLHEGLAQYIAGQVPADVHVSLAGKELYRLDEINDMFRSPDNGKGRDYGLAYRQCASLVTFIAETAGPDSLREILTLLGKGRSADQAVTAVMGSGVSDLEAAWKQYLGTLK